MVARSQPSITDLTKAASVGGLSIYTRQFHCTCYRLARFALASAYFGQYRRKGAVRI